MHTQYSAKIFFSKYIFGVKFNADHEYYIQFYAMLLQILKYLGQTHSYYIILQKLYSFHLHTIRPIFFSTMIVQNMKIKNTEKSVPIAIYLLVNIQSTWVVMQ